jgi:hypothetical protein
MTKIEILDQISENLEHMNAIERVTKLADQDGFTTIIQREYHVLREENGTLIREYYKLIEGDDNHE